MRLRGRRLLGMRLLGRRLLGRRWSRANSLGTGTPVQEHSGLANTGLAFQHVLDGGIGFDELVVCTLCNWRQNHFSHVVPLLQVRVAHSECLVGLAVCAWDPFDQTLASFVVLFDDLYRPGIIRLGGVRP